MTVSVTNNRAQYTGNGSVDTFAYTFEIYEDGDLDVYLDGTLQTLTTHYTVTGAGTPSGGNVVFVTPPASGVKVTIIRTLDATQQVDYTAYDAFPAETHETALDRLTYISQQLIEELGRCMQLDPTSSITFPPFVIPDDAADRENKLITFSADGSQLEVTHELGTWRGDWVTATSYYKRDFFKDPATENIYYVLQDHTSAAAIATDVSGGNVELLVDITALPTQVGYAEEWASKAEDSLISAAAGGDEVDDYSSLHHAAKALASAAAAAASASAASTSETNAASSASAASTSASNASTSETNAAASAAAASASETNAGASETNAAASAAAAASSASSGMYKDVVTITFADSPYTVTELQTGDLISVDTSGGAVTVNLPNLSTAAADFRVAVAKMTADANEVTVSRQGTDTINGATSHTVDDQYERYNYVGDQSTGKYLAAGGLGEGVTGGDGIAVAGGVVSADLVASGAGLSISGGKLQADGRIGYLEKSANYTITTTDLLGVDILVVRVNAAAASRTITLPTPANYSGKIIHVIADVDPAGNSVITNKSGGTEYHTGYAKGDFIKVTSDGSSDIILDEDVTVRGMCSLTADLSVSAGATVQLFSSASYSEEVDIGGWFDAVTNDRWDVPFDCLFELLPDVVHSGNTRFQLGITVNAGTVLTDRQSSADAVRHGLGKLIPLTASDYLRVQMENGGGVSYIIHGDAAKDETQIQWRVIKRLR